MQKRKKLNLDSIIDLCIEARKVLYISSPGKVEFIQLPESEFIKLKFELIKFIKKKPRLEDRYLPFELEGNNGVYSFEKEEALREARKTKQERDEDREFNNQLKEFDDANKTR